MAWADARLAARRQAREQRYLQRLEVKALQAQGLSKAEAEERAAAVAAALVDGAAEAQKARKAGKEADLRGMVKSARTGKPKPGFNIAGKRLRDLWLRDLLNDWLGRRLRFALGVLLLGAGLLWMFQNALLTDKNSVVELARTGEVMLAVTTLSEPVGKPLGVVGVPAKAAAVVDSYRVPLAGAALLFKRGVLLRLAGERAGRGRRGRCGRWPGARRPRYGRDEPRAMLSLGLPEPF